MKYIFFVALLSIITKKTFSQNDYTKNIRNIIYVEALGVGGYGSINYERVLYVRNYLIFAARSGLSTNSIKDYTNKFNPNILIPIAINGCYGKSHKIECGVGETYSNIVYTDYAKLNQKRITHFHTTISVGYRYQKNTRGVIFRCAYTPVIEFNKYYRHWVGISAGYAF